MIAIIAIIVVVIIVIIIIYFTKLPPRTISDTIIKKLNNNETLTDSEKRSLSNGYLVELIRSVTISVSSFSMKADVSNKNKLFQYSSLIPKIRQNIVINYDDIAKILDANDISDANYATLLSYITDVYGSDVFNFIKYYPYVSKTRAQGSLGSISVTERTKIFAGIKSNQTDKIIAAIHDDFVKYDVVSNEGMYATIMDFKGLKSYPYRILFNVDNFEKFLHSFRKFDYLGNNIIFTYVFNEELMKKAREYIAKYPGPSEIKENIIKIENNIVSIQNFIKSLTDPETIDKYKYQVTTLVSQKNIQENILKEILA